MTKVTNTDGLEEEELRGSRVTLDANDVIQYRDWMLSFN